MENTAKRLAGFLSDLSRQFPDAWKQIEEMRQEKGKKLPDWPDWCFLPIAGALVIPQNHGIPLRMASVGTWPAKIAALGAWRHTKGVYSFDEGIFDALWDTPIETIPVDILKQIPEWCLYLVTPRRQFLDRPLNGVFAHLEHDANVGRAELRFLFDVDADEGPALVPGLLHLNHPTLDEAIRAAAENTRKNGRLHGVPQSLLAESLKSYESLRDIAGPVISLLLYLCSQNAEIRSPRDPKRLPAFPKPVPTKRGPRLFEAERIGVWECGWRTGAALRSAIEAQNQNPGGPGGRTSPKPHIRRAHWHHYRVGPRADSKLVVRWLPPTLVNTETPEALIPTEHKVS